MEDDPFASAIDLTGVVIQHKKNITRDSEGDLIQESTSYDYIISGTVTGSGAFDFIQPGTDLGDALEMIDSGFSENLSGIIINPRGVHPFTLVNKTMKGSFQLGPLTARAKARIKAGIRRSDEPFFSITGVSFTAGIFSARPGDRITFDKGSVCNVLIPAGTQDPQQPDLLFSLVGQEAIGNNIYTGQNVILTSPRGHLSKCNILVQNDGTETDSFTVKGPAGTPDVSIKYFLKKKDVTAQVVAGTFTLSNVPSRTGVVITARVKTKKADAILEGDVTATSSVPATTDTFHWVIAENDD